MIAAVPSANRQGFSLVEVMVSMTLLGVAIMSLGGAATLGLSQMAKARQDLEYSADVQQVADSLVSVGWNKVSSGSATIRGRAVNWIVSTVNPSSQRVDIVVQRRGQANMTMIYQDTVRLYLAKSQIQ